MRTPVLYWFMRNKLFVNFLGKTTVLLLLLHVGVDAFVTAAPSSFIIDVACCELIDLPMSESEKGQADVDEEIQSISAVVSVSYALDNPEYILNCYTLVRVVIPPMEISTPPPEFGR